MNQVISFYYLYIKIMFTEKVSFFYTLILPIIFAFVSINSMAGNSATEGDTVLYITLFWSFIIMTVFINGIGIQLASIRNYGTLKTYFAITGNKYGFLIGIILVQVTIALINLVIYTIILSVYYNVFNIKLLIAAILTLICSIPLAFLCMTIAALPIKLPTLTPLLNLISYPLLLLSYMEGFLLNYINPYFIIYKISQTLLGFDYSGIDLIIIATVITLIFLLSLIVIRKFRITSLTVR